MPINYRRTIIRRLIIWLDDQFFGKDGSVTGMEMEKKKTGKLILCSMSSPDEAQEIQHPQLFTTGRAKFVPDSFDTFQIDAG